MKCIIYTTDTGAVSIGCIEGKDGRLNPAFMNPTPEEQLKAIAAYADELVDSTPKERKIAIKTYTDKLIDSVLQGYIPAAEAHAAKMVTETAELVGWRIGDSTDLPGGNADGTYDRLFFHAFTDANPGNAVDVDMAKAEAIAHKVRKIARDMEMIPFDIKANIPGESASAEASRQLVRDRNAVIKTDVTAAAGAGYAALKTAVLNAPELAVVFRAMGSLK